MNAVKRWYAEATNPDAPHRRAGRRARGRRPLHRPLGRAHLPRRGAGPDERRRDGLRDGQPDARGLARGRRALRADRGHRALGLPQPDQQRPLLPRHLPRRARRPRARHHRGDEDGRRAGHRADHPRVRAARGLHRPVGLQPRRRARRGRRGGRAGQGAGRRDGRRRHDRLRGDRRASGCARPDERRDPPGPRRRTSIDERHPHRRDRPHRDRRSCARCRRAATRSRSSRAIPTGRAPPSATSRRTPGAPSTSPRPPRR